MKKTAAENGERERPAARAEGETGGKKRNAASQRFLLKIYSVQLREKYYTPLPPASRDVTPRRTFSLFVSASFPVVQPFSPSLPSLSLFLLSASHGLSERRITLSALSRPLPHAFVRPYVPRLALSLALFVFFFLFDVTTAGEQHFVIMRISGDIINRRLGAHVVCRTALVLYRNLCRAQKREVINRELVRTTTSLPG